MIKNKFNQSIHTIHIVCLMILLFPIMLHANSPSELIDRFYNCRKFMHIYAMEIAAGGSLSMSGHKATGDILFDYTVVEISIDPGTAAYAEIEVKSRTVGEGIQSRKEFWKMYRYYGVWRIDNIYTPQEWQIRKACRSGASLSERVEALASFRCTYEIDDVPAGTPVQKCVAYINRYDYEEAFFWAEKAVKEERSAEAYFLRGLLNYVYGRIDQANSDLNIAIRADGRYYFLLMRILSDSQQDSSDVHETESARSRAVLMACFQDK